MEFGIIRQVFALSDSLAIVIPVDTVRAMEIKKGDYLKVSFEKLEQANDSYKKTS